MIENATNLTNATVRASEGFLGFLSDYWQELSALITIILLGLGLVFQKKRHEYERAMQQSQQDYDKKKSKLQQSQEEMHKLVGPLYTYRHDSVRFANILFTASETGEHVPEHHNFWNEIRPFIYLGSDELRSALEIYIERKVKKIEKKEDGTKNQEDLINEAGHSLIEQIEKRHSELTTELSNLKKQLKELQTENT